MAEILGSEHGLSALLAGVIVLLALNLITRIGEFVFKMLQKKSQTTDEQIARIARLMDDHTMKNSMALTQNTDAVRELRVQISVLQQELGDVKKFKSDSDMLLSAVKILAGQKWPRVRKAIEDDRPPKA
jgi:hypothetical protein